MLTTWFWMQHWIFLDGCFHKLWRIHLMSIRSGVGRVVDLQSGAVCWIFEVGLWWCAILWCISQVEWNTCLCSQLHPWIPIISLRKFRMKDFQVSAMCYLLLKLDWTLCHCLYSILSYSKSQKKHMAFAVKKQIPLFKKRLYNRMLYIINNEWY